MHKAFDLLGFRVRDVITDFAGVASSVSFDLYGCVQILVNPGFKDGKFQEQAWFDSQRLVVTDTIRVLHPPTFDSESGPENKPSLGN